MNNLLPNRKFINIKTKIMKKKNKSLINLMKKNKIVKLIISIT